MGDDGAGVAVVPPRRNPTRGSARTLQKRRGRWQVVNCESTRQQLIDGLRFIHYQFPSAQLPATTAGNDRTASTARRPRLHKPEQPGALLQTHGAPKSGNTQRKVSSRAKHSQRCNRQLFDRHPQRQQPPLSTLKKAGKPAELPHGLGGKAHSNQSQASLTTSNFADFHRIFNGRKSLIVFGGVLQVLQFDHAQVGEAVPQPTVCCVQQTQLPTIGDDSGK